MGRYSDSDWPRSAVKEVGSESGWAGSLGERTARHPEGAHPGIPGRGSQLEASYWEEGP